MITRLLLAVSGACVMVSTADQCSITRVPDIEATGCIVLRGKQLECTWNLENLRNCSENTMKLLYFDTDWNIVLREDVLKLDEVQNSRVNLFCNFQDNGNFSCSWSSSLRSNAEFFTIGQQIFVQIKFEDPHQNISLYSNILKLAVRYIAKGVSLHLHQGATSPHSFTVIGKQNQTLFSKNICGKVDTAEALMVKIVITSPAHIIPKQEVEVRKRCKGEKQAEFSFTEKDFPIYPHTTYVLRVQTMYLFNNHNTLPQYKGDVTEITVTTDSTVPYVFPKPCKSYLHLSDDENKTRVQIYWQPLKLTDRNGELICTRIRAFELDSVTTISTCSVCQVGQPQFDSDSGAVEAHMDPDIYSAQLNLPRNGFYQVYVDVINSEGCAVEASFENIQPINVNTLNQLPGIDRVAVEDKGPEIFIFWTSLEDAVNYTIYYCIPDQQMNSKCEENSYLKEITLSGLQSNYTLKPNTTEIPAVAVSALLNSTTWGYSRTTLMFNKCVYSAYEKLKAVQEVKVRNVGNGPIEVKWRNPECTTTALLSHYVLHYCTIEGRSCVDEQSYIVSVDENPANHYQQEYLMDGVASGVKYRIWLSSHSPYPNIPAVESESKTITAFMSKGMSLRVKWAIGAVASILLVLALLGVVCIVWRCRAKFKKIKERFPITLPPDIKEYENGDEQLALVYMCPEQHIPVNQQQTEDPSSTISENHLDKPNATVHNNIQLNTSFPENTDRNAELPQEQVDELDKMTEETPFLFPNDSGEVREATEQASLINQSNGFCDATSST